MKEVEKELRQAFEETTRRNVVAIKDHSNETRRLLRNLEDKVDNLQNSLISRDKIIDKLRLQIASLQQKVFNSGT